MVEGAEGFEDVDGADDVGLPGFCGDVVGEADEGLCGEVEDEVRVGGGDRVFDLVEVAYVTNFHLDTGGEVELIEEAWLGGRWQ